MATANARSRGGMAPMPTFSALLVKRVLGQRVDVRVAQIAGHDDDRYRKRADRVGHHGDDRAGTFRAGIGGQNKHRDVDVLFDDVEHLFGRIALADHAFRGDRGNAIGAAGRAIERGVSFLLRLGAHDVGDPQPLLVLVLGFDDAQHHHASPDPYCPAAGVVDRAVPFRSVVNDNKAFWLVTRLVATSLGGHAGPDAAPSKPHAATARPSPTSGVAGAWPANVDTGFAIATRATVGVRCVI